MLQQPGARFHGGPCYTHARNGIINRRDVDQMVEFLVAMLQKLDGPTVAAIRDFTP